MNKKEKILAFIPLVIADYLSVLDGTVVNVSLPNMAKYFHTNISAISWISIAYLIPLSALLIVFSKLADIFGRKRILLIGLMIFGISSIFCGFSISLPMMIICRILQGTGAAILTPLAMPIIRASFDKKDMEKLVIAIGVIIAVASASGPVIGGVLNEYFGFKAVFFINIPFILIALVLGLRFVKESYDRTSKKKIDIIGVILIAYALSALTFSIVEGNNYGWTSPSIMVLLVSSIIALVAFKVYESKIENPMMEMKLFKTRSFTASVVLISVTFFGVMPMSYLMNFYLENQLHYSVIKAGLVIGMPSVVTLLTAPAFNVISARISARFVSLIALVFVSSGNLIFFFINGINNMYIIYSSLILLGIGFGATIPLYNSAYGEIAPDKNGIASGVLTSFEQLASCIATAVATILVSYFSRLMTSEGIYIYSRCFIIIGVIVVLGLAAVPFNSKDNDALSSSSQDLY